MCRCMERGFILICRKQQILLLKITNDRFRFIKKDCGVKDARRGAGRREGEKGEWDY